MKSNIAAIKRAAVYRTPSAKRRKAKKNRLAVQAVDTSPIAVKIRELGYATYAEYLAGAHWQDFKDRFYAWFQASFGRIRCQWCGRGGPFNVHHVTYARLGRERFDDVRLLCRNCHKRAHGRH